MPTNNITPQLHELTQVDAINIVTYLGDLLRLQKHVDRMGVSFYGESDNTVIRISDHSTYLRTWLDNGSYSAENKYSIVIEVNPSKPNPAVNKDVNFTVTEFKHKLKSLGYDDVLLLVNAIKGAIGSGGQFSNPFHVKPKLIAAKYSASTMDSQTTDKSNNIQEMITAERGSLTRAELKSIIREAIRNGLKKVKQWLCL